jgi:hypothetical protein
MTVFLYCPLFSSKKINLFFQKNLPVSLIDARYSQQNAAYLGYFVKNPPSRP